jgi:diguanylate cyclase (GGDEF)-like protein
MLIGVVFLLTWRAQGAQARLQRIISVESRAIEVLNALARGQSAFMNQWRDLTARGGAGLPELAARYAAVEQMLDDRSLRDGADVELRRATRDFDLKVKAAAGAWERLPEAERATVSREINRLSESISHSANATIARTQAEIDQRLPASLHDATNTMWTALGVAYIVFVVGLAIARLTIAKVVEPIEHLSRAAERIASGDHSARAPIAGDREVAQLGEAFNRMARAVEESSEELARRARTDELTLLPNFRAFRERIAAEIDRASRYDEIFGVLVFDLDHFKQYNDRHGHLAGNEALRAVAGAIRAGLRSVDFPSRYGGEEFAAILPQVDAESLMVVAERIRNAVEALSATGGSSALTISIGGALYPEDGIDAESLFKTADRRLYDAKEHGRNRVVGPGRAAVTVRA